MKGNELREKVVSNIGKVIIGKEEVVTLLLTALLAEGHVLLEDVPGTGKTKVAKSLAKSLDAAFSRMLAPGCCDVASDFLDSRIGIDGLFGMVFAGLASMHREMETVKSDVLEDRGAVANALDSLRDEIRTNKSEFDSLASNFASHDLKTELWWLKQRVTKELIELLPDSGSFSCDALLACYSARRLTEEVAIECTINLPAEMTLKPL